MLYVIVSFLVLTKKIVLQIQICATAQKKHK